MGESACQKPDSLSSDPQDPSEKAGGTPVAREETKTGNSPASSWASQLGVHSTAVEAGDSSWLL